MSTSRGIFDSFASQPSPQEGAPQPNPSPFTSADKPSGFSGVSPFQAAPEVSDSVKKESPFQAAGSQAPSEHMGTKLPERRKPELEASPFQIAEQPGFGFEAPAPVAQYENQPIPQQAPAISPFSVAPTSASEQVGYGGWQQPEASPAQVSQEATLSPFQAAYSPQPTATASPVAATYSDSSTIKQLELRAIFGVDREMTHEEIMQRARTLPGIRQIAKVGDADVNVVDQLKSVISNLGFGDSPVKLYTGSTPIDFIREGKTLLAVQTDGGFAPGVRETLMLIARELGR